MHLNNSLAQAKDQYNFKIFYVSLIENIGTNVNREINGYTSILCKSPLVKENVPSFDNLMDKQTIYFNPKKKRQSIWYNKSFFIKNIYDLMSFITYADAI